MILVVVLSNMGHLNPPSFHTPYSLQQMADGDEVLDDLIDLTVFIVELYDGELKFLSLAWRGRYYF
jgi:hypothetical protein